MLSDMLTVQFAACITTAAVAAGFDGCSITVVESLTSGAISANEISELTAGTMLVLVSFS